MKRRILIKKIILYTILIIGAGFCLMPLVWLVRSSFMTTGQIFVTPPVWIPKPFKPENYKLAMTALPFGRYFLNTIIITAGNLAGVLISSSICAYSFARLRWRGRNIVFAVLMASMMLPSAVTLIPTFIGWRMLGLIDTFFPLILPAWFGGGAFNIFLLRQFYMGIPKELDEAALMDGATHFQIFTRIILPLSKPALIVVGLFTFLNTWNDFFNPLIYLNSNKNFTVALGLQSFQSMYGTQWNLLMAASTVVVIPVIIVFLIGQKYFIEGITLTGIKG
ncbi:carbohydrate ABC transporter permease [Alkaliphilus peptidifermentans]|uniref:Multiple sugar transport system permease protein n=1 Tax=Alkaliphilus peptidifermentans DSM 18978 TaxID=1120976 RepID=A0A1G5IT10_9FIRM|nr:carbohydrate ABC transporter permease [Alkaliphilus peptidifermentans]SCY79212.1 multiple sugar transport system permease protein [Alkaliphilus peptidifermentans DSM 18978]